jgi:hypothetical protein
MHFLLEGYNVLLTPGTNTAFITARCLVVDTHARKCGWCNCVFGSRIVREVFNLLKPSSNFTYYQA